MDNKKNNNNSIITDINKAKEAKGEQPDQSPPDESMMSQIENMDFDINGDQPMEEQVSNMHGKILMRVMNKINLSGKKVSKMDVQQIAHTVNQIMQQKIMYAILEEVGVDSIDEVITEEIQNEIVDIFGIKSDLNVSKEDLENLDV